MNNIRWVLVTVLVSMACYIAWVWVSGYDDVAQGVGRIGWQGFLILLGLSLVNYALRFVRWHWLLSKVSGTKVPFGWHSLVYVAGFALTTTPGKVGEALRSVYLRDKGVRVPDSLAALFAERLLDLIAVLIIGCLALVRFEEYRWVGILTLCLISFAVVFVHSRHCINGIKWVQRRAGDGMMAKAIAHGVDMLEASADFLQIKLLVPAVLIGLVAWGAEAYGFGLLVYWLTSAEWVEMGAGIYALSMLVGALSFLPGGLGSAEAVMGGMLWILGVSTADAATATIVCRVVTLWFAVVLGLKAWAWLQWRDFNKD